LEDAPASAVCTALWLMLVLLTEMGWSLMVCFSVASDQV